MSKHNFKKLISLIYGIMMLSVMRAYAAETSNCEVSGDKEGTPIVGRTGHPMSSSDIAYRNRKAEDTYNKRNAKITPWMEGNARSNVGNAALLYYQAFLLRPEPNETIDYKLRTLSSDNKPDRQVRIYLGHCLPMIELVEIASRRPICIWDVWPKNGLSRMALRQELGPLHDIILADARALAADGHYHVALERCLTVRRIARQLDEDPELYIYYTWIDKRALRSVKDVLNVMPPDVKMLTWFRGKLVDERGVPSSFVKRIHAYVVEETRSLIQTISVAKFRNMLINGAEDEHVKENIRNLTDEQILLRADNGFQCLMDLILRIVDNKMTYEQKISEIKLVANELTGEDDTDPITKQIIDSFNMGGPISGLCSSYIDHIALINGIKSAVEVYLIVAKTGELPEKLPDYLPKDPYTGRDFLYEITTDGFVLGCNSDKFKQGKERFAFKVQKPTEEK